jgi:hypothetical protein
VPPGSGTLNIITTNVNAAASAIIGSRRTESVRFSRADAHDHSGAITPHAGR